MSDMELGTDLSTWFSTYGLLTSQRILERFNIHLTNDELIAAMKDPTNLNYLWLRIPLKNIMNGIIFQQTHDYQVYAQKLFIDYLLSAESGKEADSPGANTRDNLEEERKKLQELNDAFGKQELAHQTLIAESQASLIEMAKKFENNPAEMLRPEIEKMLSVYIEKTEDMAISFRMYRSQFYDLILRVTELLQLLPDYRPDESKVLENRIPLHFDANIGGQ